MNKVKVYVDLIIREIPRNYIYVDVPENIENPEEYAKNYVNDILTNGDIAIMGDSNLIPKKLIKNINIFVKKN